MKQYFFLNKSIRQFCFLMLAGCTQLAAQNDYTAAIQEKFDQYRKSAVQEKIFVHTDRNFYLAGEIVWFSIYNVDGSFHKPSGLSKIAYVELLDKERKPVMQGKIALQKGKGDGSFYLPASVNSGHYLLRVYTGWMKNFGPDYFFEKKVTVVNTMKPLYMPPPDTVQQYDVQFLPEGGNLVSGIESKVAFRASDKYGKGLSFTGVLVSERGDTITHFRPLKHGIGHFLFTPSAGQHYRALLRLDNGENISKVLPAAYDRGYVMRVQEYAGNNIQVSVYTNISETKEIFLFAHTRQSVKVATKQPVENGKAVFSFRRERLGDGVSHFTVFTGAQQPVCERLYFKYPEHILDISANSDYRHYTPRQHVNLSVHTKTGDHVVPATLSLSVYRLDSLQQADANTLPVYWWLTADLKGIIESPEYYFSGKDPGIARAMDNLMLVHGWRRFSWEEVLTSQPAAFAFAPEFNGHIITGKVSHPASETPAQNITTWLSVPGIQVQCYPSQSNQAGQVSFDVRDYYGQNELILQADLSGNSSYRLDIANPFSEKYSATILPPLRLPATFAGDLINNNLGMQVQNTYAGEKLSRFVAPAIDSLSFYGIPDRRYLLDDYVRFTTMEEVLREYVPEVAIRRYGKQLHLHVFNNNAKTFFSNDPLILLDGVPVNNTTIMEYDPLKVEKLEVTTAKYIRGQYTYDGIASFITYDGDMGGLKLDNRAVILDYDGLQLKREFYAPVYETEQQVASRLPDFRNLLFWAPDVQTGNSGAARLQFYTSDLLGKYIAVVQGMDENGHAGYSYFTFEVKGE